MTKLSDVASEEFIKGIKQGLEIAKNVCEREGYEMYFPDIDEIEVEKTTKQISEEKQ